MQATAQFPAAANRSPAPPQAPQHHHAQVDPLHHLDEVVESAVGADMRLLYGMAVPMLVVFGLILVFVAQHSVWLVALALVVEIGCLGLIVTKLMAMLNDDDAEEPPAPGAQR